MFKIFNEPIGGIGLVSNSNAPYGCFKLIMHNNAYFIYTSSHFDSFDNTETKLSFRYSIVAYCDLTKLYN